MYQWMLILFLLRLSAVRGTTLNDCACWDGYEAKLNEESQAQCLALNSFDIKPCNMPKPPRCVCDSDTVTDILTDKEGTWCSISKNGELVKKWPCENIAEWNEYLEKYNEFLEENTDST